MFRSGIGQDSHRFTTDKGKKLVLGGAIIANETGLESNSDGDVVLHALFNAISQAVGKSSIGAYDADLPWEKDSRMYIGLALKMLGKAGYEISNVGITVEAKRPLLQEHEPLIKKSISAILKVGIDRVGLNFTSGEGLTAFGRGEGIQVFAIATIIKKDLARKLDGLRVS